ncbi:MAG TPA: Holliday junction branch migration DNA helicase RuvB [Candidatus Krumholzibacteria bacterium]|nr:Holliday junction branch migration DNA helicase RuvB [Candidatus Krumholzibacteria bacterium]HPD71372.1 Holliday junction branch migration DNA helicase RuvB [Candidatus Krumholzibacteria bacterium]HRY38928.1 Holliday junction branch migration DNA helicase RuvB [Candidatus Krumholzibacteria bacterium]
MDETRWTDPAAQPEDRELDRSLRPRSLDEFVGQQKIKDNLRIFVEAARQRGEVLDHVLLYGPPGLGKTTLAQIIAVEMAMEIRLTSGPAFQNSAELIALLSEQSDRRVLFIDEVHRLNRVIEEHLYPAMEDWRVELVIDKGPGARHFNLQLEPFTLIGATTRAGLITPALRSRFGIVCHLDFYPASELATIVTRSAGLLRIALDPEGALEIARRSRGTPRTANRVLRRIRDIAQVQGRARIDRATADHGLGLLGVDQLGLEPLDRRYLQVICEHFQGGPVGIQNLAVSLGEEVDTLEDVVEPYLIQSGLVKRTSRGREVTPGGWRHLGLETPGGDRAAQGELL